MTSRKTLAVMAFMLPLTLSAMGAGGVSLLPAIENEFGVSRTALSLASLGGLVAGLAAGPLVDWKGPRPLVVVGGLVAALGFLVFSTASGLPIALVGGFLASAGIGLAGGIVIQILIAGWFVQYRGTFLGFGLGGGFGSLLVGFIAGEDSWSIASLVLALLGLGVAVAGFTLVHSYPSRDEEDQPSKVRVPGRRSPQLERIIPPRQYATSPGPWRSLVLLGLASAAVLWVISGLTITGEWAIEERTGSESALFGIGSLVGGLAWSVGADFWARNRLLWLSGSGAVVLLVLVLVSFVSPLGVIGLWALLFPAGVFLGGLGALIALTFVDYMGVRLLGTLSLAFGLLSGVGVAAGPLLAGVLIEAGGLWGVFLLGVPLTALAVFAATRAPFPTIELERLAPTV